MSAAPIGAVVLACFLLASCLGRVPNRDAIEVMLTRQYRDAFLPWCHWRNTGDALRRGTYYRVETQEFLELGAREGLWTLTDGVPTLTALGARYFTGIDVEHQTFDLVQVPHRRFRVVDVLDTGDPDLKNFEFRHEIVEAPEVVSRWCETNPFVMWGSIRRHGLGWRLE